MDRATDEALSACRLPASPCRDAMLVRDGQTAGTATLEPSELVARCNMPFRRSALRYPDGEARFSRSFPSLSLVRDADIVESIVNPLSEEKWWVNERVDRAKYDPDNNAVSNELFERIRVAASQDRRRFPDRELTLAIFDDSPSVCLGDFLIRMLASASKLKRTTVTAKAVRPAELEATRCRSLIPTGTLRRGTSPTPCTS